MPGTLLQVRCERTGGADGRREIQEFSYILWPRGFYKQNQPMQNIRRLDLQVDLGNTTCFHEGFEDFGW